MHVEISVIDQYVEKYGCVDKSALAGESVLADSLPIHYLNAPIIYSSGGCIEPGGRSCAVR